MTEDVKATRLSKAAREFNVGISTIIEFLHRKGFDLDPNPNTKLPHEAYLLLLKEYSSDLNVKKESEKLILKDLHRKKESVSIDDVPEQGKGDDQERDDEVLIKDTSAPKKAIDIKTEIKKPDIKLVGKIDLDKALKPKVVVPEPPKPEEEKKIHKEAPKPEEPEKKKPAAEKPKETEVVPAKEEKTKAPIDLHIVGKIDLDAIAGEQKTQKKEEKVKHKPVSTGEAVEEIKKEEVQKPAEPETELPQPAIPVVVTAEGDGQKPVPEPEEEPELYKTEIKKLSGPTVVGKI